MNGYLQSELSFKCELAYESLNNAVGGGWDWNSGRNGRQGYVEVTSDLERALAKNPDFKVLVATGYYDLGTPYFSIRYALDHLAFDSSITSRIASRVYDSGHQLYILPSASKKFSEDGEAFFKWSIESVR
jgi:carboxypeptidase C (cathepsin A)